MFLGLEWYWWLVIAALVIVIPIKIKFMQWWGKRQREQGKNQKGKWGEDE